MPCEASWAQTWSMAALPGHAEGHHDAAALVLDEPLAGHAQVLEPGHRPVHDLERRAVPRAAAQLVDGLGAHVVAGEHGVDHTDPVHGPEPTGAGHGTRSDPRRGRRLPPSCRGVDPVPRRSTRLCADEPRRPARPRAAAGAWVARDAAVVWHGFTQMAAYPDNAPITVERAEGRELIDVDGRRYFDAISSLWVTTLGHRVPELDARRGRPAGPGGPLHPARQRQHRGGRVRRGAGRGGAGRRRPRAVRLRRGGGRRAGPQDRLPVLDQPGRAGPHRASWPWATPTTATPSGPCRWATADSAPTCFDPLRFPVVRTPGYATPTGRPRLVGGIEADADELAAVVIEPLVQGASGMLVAEPADLARVGEACRRARGAAHLRRGGHRLRADGQAVRLRVGRTRVPPRPAVPGQGHHRRLPPPVGHRGLGRGVRRLRRAPTSGERTFYHGHSYGGNALACAVALRHLQLIEEWDVLANVTAVAAHLADRLAGSIAGSARRAARSASGA